VSYPALVAVARPVLAPTISGGLPRHGRRCDPAVSDCTWYLLGPLLATLVATAFALALTEVIMRWPDIRWPWSR
jgi:hypothetical protein